VRFIACKHQNSSAAARRWPRTGPSGPQALEFVRSALGEFQAGAGDEIVTTRETKTSLDCVSPSRERRRETAMPDDVAAPDLDFTGVASPARSGRPILLGGGAECQRASGRAGGRARRRSPKYRRRYS